MAKGRILIIDGLNLAIRAYMADPTLSPQGAHIGGIQGFLKMLQKYMRQVKPTKIAIAWDGAGGSTKRKSINENYKAGRKPARLNRFFGAPPEDEDYSRIWQQGRLIQYLTEMPVHQFVVDGVEADDLVSWLCINHYCEEWERVIVSNDKDFIQLLDECTLLYRPATNKMMNMFDVIDEYGIHPTNFALARAVCGDKSDNLDGVPGVGLKTLAKRCPFLVEDRHCSIDELVEFCRTQNSKLKIFNSIPEHKEVIASNYRIMQLSSPSMSFNDAQLLEEQSKSRLIFNKPELSKYMREDGIPEYMFVEMFDYFARLMKSEDYDIGYAKHGVE